MTLLLAQVHSPAELEQLIETRLPAFLDRMPVGVIGSRIHPSMRVAPARSPTTLASCPTHVMIVVGRGFSNASFRMRLMATEFHQWCTLAGDIEQCLIPLRRPCVETRATAQRETVHRGRRFSSN